MIVHVILTRLDCHLRAVWLTVCSSGITRAVSSSIIRVLSCYTERHASKLHTQFCFSCFGIFLRSIGQKTLLSAENAGTGANTHVRYLSQKMPACLHTKLCYAIPGVTSPTAEVRQAQVYPTITWHLCWRGCREAHSVLELFQRLEFPALSIHIPAVHYTASCVVWWSVTGQTLECVFCAY